jgi:hypothetical protein
MSANKDKIIERNKAYCEANKDKIREYQKKYRKEYNKIKIICECGRESLKKHIGRHLKSNKHIKWEKDMDMDFEEGTMDSGQEDNEIWGTGQDNEL